MRFYCGILALLVGLTAWRATADDRVASALARDQEGWTDLLARAGPKLEGWTRAPFPPQGKLGARSQWSLDATTG